MIGLSAPANILLLGEYAVLEEGGIGVTLAAKRRLTASLFPAQRLEILGHWGGHRERWPGAGPSLLSYAVRSVAGTIHRSEEELSRLPVRVEIDSSPFYDSNGAKTGFGSSAAVTAVLCYALLDAAEGASAGHTDSSAALLDMTFAAALDAHRSFQGGGGSGYDIAASVYGGIGRFEGGRAPSFSRIALPWLPRLALFRGASSIKTPNAVQCHREWQGTHPSEARRFLKESNRLVEGFLRSKDWEGASLCVGALRDLGVEHGRAIGVPADIAPAAGTGGALWKAVGAGNELGVLFMDRRTGTLSENSVHATDPPLITLEISNQGIRKYQGTEAVRGGRE